MVFREEYMDYIRGEKFSNGLKLKVSNTAEKTVSRVEYLNLIVKNKKVIHLGCTDHIPLINEKIETQTWLHKILCDSATRCLGVDINEESVRYVRDILGYKDVVVHNMLDASGCVSIEQDKWDYIILGEILEHVDNPVHFLAKIKEKYGNYIDKIVITVPNAFDFDNIKLLWENTECINTDHRYWFTVFTLAKVIAQAGMKVSHYQLSQSHSISYRHFLKKILLHFCPIFCNTIIMVAEMKDNR